MPYTPLAAHRRLRNERVSIAPACSTYTALSPMSKLVGHTCQSLVETPSQGFVKCTAWPRSTTLTPLLTCLPMVFLYFVMVILFILVVVICFPMAFICICMVFIYFPMVFVCFPMVSKFVHRKHGFICFLTFTSKGSKGSTVLRVSTVPKVARFQGSKGSMRASSPPMLVPKFQCCNLTLLVPLVPTCRNVTTGGAGGSNIAFFSPSTYSRGGAAAPRTPTRASERAEGLGDPFWVAFV